MYDKVCTSVIIPFGHTTNEHCTEAFLSKFVEMQGLSRVLAVMMDQSVEVQGSVLILLATLVESGDCREKLIRLGLVDKLKIFANRMFPLLLSFFTFPFLFLFFSFL